MKVTAGPQSTGCLSASHLRLLLDILLEGVDELRERHNDGVLRSLPRLHLLGHLLGHVGDDMLADLLHILLPPLQARVLPLPLRDSVLMLPLAILLLNLAVAVEVVDSLPHLPRDVRIAVLANPSLLCQVQLDPGDVLLDRIQDRHVVVDAGCSLLVEGDAQGCVAGVQGFHLGHQRRHAAVQIVVVGLEGALQVATEPGLELVQDLGQLCHLRIDGRADLVQLRQLVVVQRLHLRPLLGSTLGTCFEHARHLVDFARQRGQFPRMLRRLLLRLPDGAKLRLGLLHLLLHGGIILSRIRRAPCRFRRGNSDRLQGLGVAEGGVVRGAGLQSRHRRRLQHRGRPLRGIRRHLCRCLPRHQRWAAWQSQRMPGAPPPCPLRP
mmetsp:Transcript_47036/g.138942  ORF Transcript_47036/g.138942 Transcript_47036/m.138942 type:complete len:380 (-) Transcript_47036:2-1141(-)